jgi:aminopeptidase N
MMRLYHAVAGEDAGDDVAPALTHAGGISPSLISAFRSVLLDDSVDGTFKAFAISLPADSVLVDAIPAVDPTLLHKVRQFVVTKLAGELRPELEAAIKIQDARAEDWAFNAESCAGRALKNKALVSLRCR